MDSGSYSELAAASGVAYAQESALETDTAPVRLPGLIRLARSVIAFATVAADRQGGRSTRMPARLPAESWPAKFAQFVPGLAEAGDLN
jgi:hypothetical protein